MANFSVAILLLLSRLPDAIFRQNQVNKNNLFILIFIEKVYRFYSDDLKGLFVLINIGVEVNASLDCASFGVLPTNVRQLFKVRPSLK